MGEGASKADEPPSLEELRALWRKHDANGSAELERFEVRALLDDFRTRFGLEDPLPVDFTDQLFDEFDLDDCGTWSWHDLRHVAVEKFPQVKRRLKRIRLQKGSKHFKANKKKEEQTWAEWAGFGGSAGNPAQVAPTRREPGPQVELLLHALRAQGFQAEEGAFFFRPYLELRVERGDPRRGPLNMDSVDDLGVVAQASGAAAGAASASSGAAADPTWSEAMRLWLARRKGLFVHVLACESGNLVGRALLGSLVLPLDEVLGFQEAPKVQHFPWHPLTLGRLDASAILVAQWGGPRPRLALKCHVLRGEKLPQDTLVAEVAIQAAGSRTILASGRSSGASGPSPNWQEEVDLECDDEGDMVLQCTVLSRHYGVTEEPVAELATPLPQAELLPQRQLARRSLRPLGSAGAGAQLTLGFGVLEKVILLVRATGGTGLAPKEGASSFDPFVRVLVKAEDPNSWVADIPVVAEGQTETLSNCYADPHWKEPVVLTFAMERGLFVQVLLCSARLMSSDELGDVVLPLEEVLRLAKAPMEKRYPLKLKHQNRRHAEPALFLSFGEGGDAGTAGAGAGLPHFGGPPSAAAPPPPPPLPAAAPPQPAAPSPGAAPWAAAGAAQAPEYIHTSTYSGVRQPPESRCPPLAQFMHQNGQPVPPVLALGSPSASALAPAPRAPRAPDEDLATLQRRAESVGGSIQGPVPLSFLRSPLNPHNAWLQQGFPR